MERHGFYVIKDLWPTLFKQPSWNERDNRFYLKDLGLSYAECKALFEAYFLHLESKGWTQAQIMQRTKMTAAWNTCFWNEVDNPALPYSRAGIRVPSGKWWFNSEMWWGNSIVEGSGNDISYGNGGCSMHLDKATYKQTRTKPHEFHGAVSWNYQLQNPSAGGTVGDWSHGATIRDICWIGSGGDNPDPNIFSCGVIGQAPGERSKIEVLANDFNDHGVCVVGPGVPINIIKCSVFYNGNAGIGLIGTGLANITIDQPSGDCNTALIRAYTSSAYGVAGGRITVINPKVESFGTNGREGRRGKGDVLAELEGDFSYTQIGGTISPQNNCSLDVMIRANPTHNICNVRLIGMEHFLVNHWLHDMKTGEKFAVDNNFFQTGDNDFGWRSDQGGKAKSYWLGEMTPAVTGASPKRIKWFDGDPVSGQPTTTANHTAGTPAFPADLWALYARDPITGTGVTPPPPPPPPPPVDPPVDPPPPPPPPPPVGTVKYTSPANMTMTPSFSITVNVPGVTKVRLTDLVATGIQYGRVVGTGANKPSLQVFPDGFFWWGTSATGYTKCASTNTAKLVTGTKWSGTVTIPTSTITTLWQTNSGQGGALPGTCKLLELL